MKQRRSGLIVVSKKRVATLLLVSVVLVNTGFAQQSGGLEDPPRLNCFRS